MKLLFIVLLAIVATAKSLECEPNSVFKMDCNTCKCSPDGYTAECTLIGCNVELLYNPDNNRDSRSIEVPEPEESEQMCVPGTTFRYYCNTCRCTDDGKNAACTLMGCDPEEWNEDGTRKTRSIEVPETSADVFDCEPNKSFSYYCNTCTCTDSGKIGGCTLMYCDPAMWNRDGTLKTSESRNSRLLIF